MQGTLSVSGLDMLWYYGSLQIVHRLPMLGAVLVVTDRWPGGRMSPTSIWYR